MTNFEKWKAGLTLSTVADKFEWAYSGVCGLCPARKMCTALHAEDGDAERTLPCRQTVHEWGEQEAQDD